MVDVHELTIAQVHDAFQKGTYSCKDLTAAYLDRIQTLDKSGPRIYSTMAMSTTALDEAAALDVYFQEHGKPKGRLHGIPVLIKDQADTKGIETRYGSMAVKGNVPTEDAFVVTKLKGEGAIVLGKTTMAEWATTWFSASSATDWEFTHNPYKIDYDVGGSSGGSAAAVAANFAMLGLAEDTGGSIRCPASFTNLVGIRVTPGLISRSGLCPLIKTTDTPGPVARTVADCALMLDCMVGYDPEDNYTGINLFAGLPAGESYAADLNPEKIKSSRIGIVRELFGSDSDPYCKAVNTVTLAAIAKLKAAGTTFIDIEIPNLDHYMNNISTYIHRSRTDINSFLATKPHLPQDIALMIPKEPMNMFHDFTSAVAHGPLNPTEDPTYMQKVLDRDFFHRTVLGTLTSQNLDALCFPDVKVPPPRHEDATNGRFPTSWDFPTNTMLASTARLPAISVPAGFTEDGLPVGLEFVSWDFREKALLELARGMEVIVNARRAPPAPL